jgi:hypothetical protein
MAAGVIERYGMRPQFEFYEVFALTDYIQGTVDRFEKHMEARRAWAYLVDRSPVSARAGSVDPRGRRASLAGRLLRSSLSSTTEFA